MSVESKFRLFSWVVNYAPAGMWMILVLEAHAVFTPFHPAFAFRGSATVNV